MLVVVGGLGFGIREQGEKALELGGVVALQVGKLRTKTAAQPSESSVSVLSPRAFESHPLRRARVCPRCILCVCVPTATAFQISGSASSCESVSVRCRPPDTTPSDGREARGSAMDSAPPVPFTGR